MGINFHATLLFILKILFPFKIKQNSEYYFGKFQENDLQGALCIKFSPHLFISTKGN